MDTRPYRKKMLRVFITGLTGLVLFVVLYHGILWLFGFRYPGPAFFITLVVIIYFYESITRIIRYFIDKSFYRRIFSINRELDKFNIELNSTLDFQLIIKKFDAFLKRTFGDYTWAFYLRWGEDFELFKWNRLEKTLPKLINLPDTKALNKIFKDQIDFYSVDRLKHKQRAMEKALLEIPGCDQFFYFFPLKSYKGYVGFLIFEKSFGYYLGFWELKKTILRILNKTADVLENDQLHSEVKRKSLQNHLLLEIGKKISASLNLNEVLEAIIDSVNQLVNYDAAGIFLINEKKKALRQMVTRGYDKDLLGKLSLKLDRGIYSWVIQENKPSNINDVTRDPNYFPVRESTYSQLTVPLINGGVVLGVMALESDRINHFTPADLELLMTFAGQAVIAIENAQLFEASMQKKRLESELVVASKVQNALLPDRPPHFPGCQISSLNIPSLIVGGDLFDIFLLGESRLAVAIGDVSGKGAPAAILMAMLYAGFRSLLKEIYPVCEVVARLNNLLTETTAHGYFATFFFGILDKEASKFTYTNAGHNQPIVLRRDQSVQRLEIGGIVLGFLGNQEYRQDTVEVQSGDYLVFFTDGITEVKNSQGEEFGDDRLIELLKRNYREGAAKLRSSILEEIRRFSARKELSDDVTLIIIYVE